ncbi:uncharacterized protein LOC144474278 isoform X2 [Augochlora pura]
MQMIPEEYKSTETTILALLLSQKKGYTLAQLCKEYYEMEGEDIPWRKLGYTSLFNFLKSMPKSIKIESSQNTIILKGIASNKSKHVSKLVAFQKDEKTLCGKKMIKPIRYYPKTLPSKLHIPSEISSMIINIVSKHPDGVNKDFVLQEVRNYMPYANVTMHDMKEQLHLLSHKISVRNNRLYPVQSSSQNISCHMPITIAGGEEQSDSSPAYGDENDFTLLPSTSLSTSIKLPAKVKTTSNIIKDSVDVVQSQLESNTTDNEHSHVTIKGKTNETDLCNTNSYNDNFEKYTISNNYDNVEEKDCLTYEHDDNLINSRVKFRLKKLIQNNPNGIWCAELPQKYLEEYTVKLDYTDFGFSSIREFASHLPEIFHCVQIDDTGDFMLYDSKRQLPSINSEKKQKITNLAELYKIYESDEEVEAIPATLTIDTCKQLIPEGVMTIGECVGEIHVADLVTVNEPYIEAFVVEVFTPSFFWIQLRKKQKKFKTFMTNLNNFYVPKHKDYIIPIVILEKGLNCACIYNEVWHRGIIKTVKPDLQVIVMFYDYGTVKEYNPTEIYYLHRMFSVPPAQAIPCGLYNIKPYKAIKWSQFATHRFAEKVSSTALVATIASIHEMDNSMLITLTDTIGDDDIHINDWLVEQKLAERGKMGDKVEMHNLLLYVEENLLFSPEKCYSNETVACDSVPIEAEEISSNTCLLTPQRTSEDNNLQDQAQSKVPTVPKIIQSKNNTNPFLNDGLIGNQDENKSIPQLFQLLTENVKLQTQITAIFQILFNSVTSNSETIDSSRKNKNILNLTESFSQLNINNNLMSSNLEDLNVINPLTFAINDVQNVSNPNDNSNFNNLNSLYSNIAIAEDSNTHSSQLLPNNSVKKSLGSASGFGKVASEINLNDQNKLMNNENITLPATLVKSTNLNVPFNETNPFKKAVENELKALQNEYCLNSADWFIPNGTQEPTVKHNSTTFEEISTAFLNSNLSNPEKNSTKHLFGDEQYFPASTASASSNVNINARYLHSNYTWPYDINDIGTTPNGLPTIVGVNVLHDVKKVRRIDNNNIYSPECNDIYTPSYLRDHSQEHKPKEEEEVVLRDLISSIATCNDHTLNYDNSHMNTLSFSSVMQENKNVDEGYLTRPSTSHAVDRLFPLAQTIAHTNQYNESAKIWSTSLVDKSVQSENYDELYPRSMKNGDMQKISNQNQLQSNWKYLYMKLIETSRCEIHIIHYQNEGWLIVNEFVSFTEHKNITYLYDVVEILDIPVPFREIDKTQGTIKFLETKCGLTQKTKDILSSTGGLSLISLMSALKLLKILKIISAQDLSDLLDHKKFENGIMHDIWIIMREYEEFEYHIEN